MLANSPAPTLRRIGTRHPSGQQPARPALPGRENALGPGTLVPREIVSRRVEALVAQGWSEAEIAQHAGLSLADISIEPLDPAAPPRPKVVHRKVFMSVDAVFRQLRHKYGGDDEARARAAAEGFAPWITWPEEGGINDLAAVPDPKGVANAEWRRAIRARRPEWARRLAQAPQGPDVAQVVRPQRETRQETQQETAKAALGVPPETKAVIEHLREILRARPGALPIDIARAAGVDQRVIYRLLNLPTPVSQSKVREALMRVQVSDIVVPPERIVEAESLRPTINATLAQGWTMRDIDRESGCSEDSLRVTLSKDVARMSLDRFERTARACAALQQRHLAGVDPVTSMPRVLLRRRVEALGVLGWSEHEIAARADVSRDTLRESPVPHVAGSLFERVDAVYRELAQVNGENLAVQNWARASGYAPTEAWVGDSMDVVEAVPDVSLIEDEAWREMVRDRYALLSAFA